MKEIKKVLIGLVSFFVLLVVVDWAVGTWSEKMYYKSKYGIFHRQIYCLQESEDDIMILGSSRAAHHYVPQMFEDSLGMSCYNAGSDGMCIYYHYAVLASRIHRGCAPKMVIYDLHRSDLEVSNRATFTLDAALDRLAPHIGTLPEIDTLFALKGWKELIKLKSKTYRYNSKLVQTIKCCFISGPEEKGYEAFNRVLKENEINVSDELSNGDNVEYEKFKIKYVEKLINLCKNNRIQLVMTYSPHYKKEIPASVHSAEIIANKYDVPFINCGLEEHFQNNEYFSDENHLNDVGAHVYTTYIIERIKNNIQ